MRGVFPIRSTTDETLGDCPGVTTAISDCSSPRLPQKNGQGGLVGRVSQVGKSLPHPAHLAHLTYLTFSVQFTFLPSASHTSTGPRPSSRSGISILERSPTAMTTILSGTRYLRATAAVCSMVTAFTCAAYFE